MAYTAHKSQTLLSITQLPSPRRNYNSHDFITTQTLPHILSMPQLYQPLTYRSMLATGTEPCTAERAVGRCCCLRRCLRVAHCCPLISWLYSNADSGCSCGPQPPPRLTTDEDHELAVSSTADLATGSCSQLGGGGGGGSADKLSTDSTPQCPGCCLRCHRRRSSCCCGCCCCGCGCGGGSWSSSRSVPGWLSSSSS